jgi:hypothetical protein
MLVRSTQLSSLPLARSHPPKHKEPKPPPGSSSSPELLMLSFVSTPATCASTSKATPPISTSLKPKHAFSYSSLSDLSKEPTVTPCTRQYRHHEACSLFRHQSRDRRSALQLQGGTTIWTTLDEMGWPEPPIGDGLCLSH